MSSSVHTARYKRFLKKLREARIEPSDLEACVAYLDEHPEVGIVGPQLVNLDGSRQNSIHNFPMLATELLPKGIFQFLFRRRFPSRRWTGVEPVDVEAVVGAALFVRGTADRHKDVPSYVGARILEWCADRSGEKGLRLGELYPSSRRASPS